MDYKNLIPSHKYMDTNSTFLTVYEAGCDIKYGDRNKHKKHYHKDIGSYQVISKLNSNK